ncbi:flavin-containing monooxygenase [Saccharothrix yanglingensis]|uniref:Monooxygenase n=1 Tax=Saccharothrix yanglingensis TaxID=659496 RepID=A0ABU0XA75_9PSEU|nr:NAD(P)/FAD-dependent oxidoreductase [Saccharothrix yanglingensis]MDQ2589046.1 monooxygenase [Saccharothrix yanglingensis]
MSRHRIVVVGAGFGGLTMGAALRAAGIDDFVILEEGDDVGGVWRENTYPGSACDVPSHLYSFGFDPYRDAEVRFPDQGSILGYMRAVADRNGLRRHLRSNTSVTSATYVDADGTWTLTTADGQLLHADAVVWAVGQLHRPAVPDLPGAHSFTGRAFHSARWDHDADLTGHVAVVGTGSSAAQMVPELARTATTVTLYQRTPPWVLPKPADRFGPVSRWALAHLPGLHRLYRAGLYLGADLLLAPITREGWSARPARWLALAHLRRQVPDRALRDKLTPDYRIGEKRILVDSRFYPALTLPHVELVTDPVDRVTGDGIRTVTGTHRHADVIVWATGFRAPEFFSGITVRGRNGVDLHAHWAERGRPEAFFGLAVPGFPSMYLIAGPHSFTPTNSNPSMKEHQVRYIMRCLELNARLGAPTAVTPAAMAAYRRRLDAALARTVWPGGVRSWFKLDSDGPVTNPWPAGARKFARLLDAHAPADAFTAVPVRDVPAR